MQHRSLFIVSLSLVAAACGQHPPVPPEHDPLDDTTIDTYELTLSQSVWARLSTNLEDEDTWYRATVTWKDETYKDVAIKPSGQLTRVTANPNKPSLWLSFKEYVPGREFHKYERVKLDAMSM